MLLEWQIMKSNTLYVDGEKKKAITFLTKTWWHDVIDNKKVLICSERIYSSWKRKILASISKHCDLWGSNPYKFLFLSPCSFFLISIFPFSIQRDGLGECYNFQLNFGLDSDGTLIGSTPTNWRHRLTQGHLEHGIITTCAYGCWQSS